MPGIVECSPTIPPARHRLVEEPLGWKTPAEALNPQRLPQGRGGDFMGGFGRE